MYVPIFHLLKHFTNSKFNKFVSLSKNQCNSLNKTHQVIKYSGFPQYETHSEAAVKRKASSSSARGPVPRDAVRRPDVLLVLRRDGERERRRRRIRGERSLTFVCPTTTFPAPLGLRLGPRKRVIVTRGLSGRERERLGGGDVTIVPSSRCFHPHS